ncbi:MAG TPA: RagB/SusD family nutrient uptake outer membrane protein, partial [Aquella sp.]|nr:RagB/SusD family nutrient uptake outer membrane protein [Aquella sp.]
MIKIKYFAALVIAGIAFNSCSKNWLDVKPDKSLVVPTTVDDMQALLNNGIFNYFLPALGELGADNYIISDVDLTSVTNVEQNAYIWAANVFEGNQVNDWTYPYKQVLYANTALEGLSRIPVDSSNRQSITTLTGIGHYYRAYAFYSIADIFASPYDSATQDTELGIPLRLSSDINDKVGRGTIRQTYSQIIGDLTQAVNDLPDTQANKLLPSKSAAYGLLARVYLNMGNYAKAFTYSDSSLKLYSHLMDYNSLDSTVSYPIPIYNNEIIYNAVLNFYNGICLKSEVDTSLYRSYDDNDLRKTLFFNNSSGMITFRGGYSGLFLLFGGLAVDEMYLIRSECNARLGNL